ncbi:MAG TPA: hypothetical protein VFY28_00030 [Candidatus Paceibacterota bacterium]|nr:hypothetical protein [Candidatus Paceibacterota bacterium]
MAFRIIWALAVIAFIIAGGWFVFGGKGNPATEEALVRTQVEGFGRAQKSVSLLSPTVANDIGEAYGAYVSSPLLAQWKREPDRAPGRLTSSPWPERIDIVQVERALPAGYLVQGELMLMTSSGSAGSVPVTLSLEKEQGVWRIAGYEEQAPPISAPLPVARDLELSLGESATALGVKLTPESIVEDSRCPQDAECIQAGTVRAATEIVSGLGTSKMVLELGQPITTEAEAVTLIAVSPEPLAGTPIRPGDYRLTFRIEKRDILP